MGSTVAEPGIADVRVTPDAKIGLFESSFACSTRFVSLSIDSISSSS